MNEWSRRRSTEICWKVKGSQLSLVAIDNWDEFLQPPDGSVSVVRAHDNWLARLAFTVASVQLGRCFLKMLAGHVALENCLRWI